MRRIPGARLRTILERRFGADYEVITQASPLKALKTLDELREKGTDVALVLANQSMPDMTGTELLAQVSSIHRDAKRALLINWGDRSTADSIIKASALGQIDTYIDRPWRDADEQFCHAVTELLDEWDRSNRPPFEAVSIVGDRWDPYTHGMQDALQRSNVPFRLLRCRQRRRSQAAGEEWATGSSSGRGPLQRPSAVEANSSGRS